MLRRILLLATVVACCFWLADFAIANDVRSLMKEGASLTVDEIAALEAQLADDPLDMSARIRLLGYHADRTRYREPSSMTRIRSLVLWLIHNEPKSNVLVALPAPVRALDAYENPEAYVEGKRAFLAHLEKEPNDLTLLEHTVQFLSLQDRALAIELLERAQSLDSSNPRWALDLGFKHYLETRQVSGEPNVEAARKALAQYERAFELSPDGLSNSRLKYASQAAIVANDLDKAREFAYLMLGDNRPGSSREDGMHYGNITLGKIALAQGDVQGAASYLLLAASVPGSSRLNMTGPDTALAKDLLEEGETGSVLRYFDPCTKFWERGQDRLREWAIVVRGGGIPSSPYFGR